SEQASQSNDKQATSEQASQSNDKQATSEQASQSNDKQATSEQASQSVNDSLINSKEQTSTSLSEAQIVQNLDKLSQNVAYNSNNILETSKLVANKRNKRAVDTKTTNKVTVASDPDSGRSNFKDKINNPGSVSTPTSVNVAIPDQIANDNKYRTNVKDVSSYDQLRQAWGDASVKYINITNNITASATTMPSRANGASVVLNGNGYTIDLKRQTFSFVGTTQSTTLTLTNVNFQQGFGARPGGNINSALVGQNDGDTYSLVYSPSGSQLTVNANNVNLKPSASTAVNVGNEPIHFVTAIGSKVVFSGNNNFEISNEVTRGVGSIIFANNSKVTMQRTSADIGFSQFYFQNIITDTNAVGYGNKIIMGDGSSNEAYTYKNSSANYPAMYLYINGVTAGDNVSWTQTGFQYFLNTNTGAGGISASAQYTFGQNFKLKAPITTMPGAIQINRQQKVVFNAGTELDINQRNNAAIIQTIGNSTVQFISPKTLHLAILNASGQPVTTGVGIISGSGQVIINNSNISTWTGSNSSTNTPNGNNNAKFSQLVVQNGRANITTVDGQSSSSNILSNNTRELSTVAIGVGDIYVQYVDQNGRNVGKPVKITLPDDAYIGKFISLNTKDYAETNMPDNYMWALGDQIYSGAKSDQQSGGDSTSSLDNGDSSTGQANVGIIPIDGSQYTYKIYVYGQPENVQYQYVDANTGKVLNSPLSGKTGSESIANNIATANFGNTIDWKNKYYTQDNIPDGYHYDASINGQATTTVVSDENGLVSILVVGNNQTISPSYQTVDGASVNPANQIKVQGVTGQTVTIPSAPNVPNLALDHVLLNGEIVTVGTSFELSNGTDHIVYVYHSLNTEKDLANVAIDTEAAKVKGEIDADKTLSDAEKTQQKANVDTEAQKAKDA
ncbi:pectate lyase-like adhesive domain-containing protein, partial [Weissella minor]|uniref:pectate lyase-like adhesive domain-containing protein n=1 Tax=Weissella minor TaxID=1620 RepID=UPI003AF1E931